MISVKKSLKTSISRDHFVRIHYAVWIEYVLHLPIKVKNLWRFLYVEMMRLLDSYSMLRADASFFFGYDSEYFLVINYCIVLRADVDMNVAISNMPVS